MKQLNRPFVWIFFAVSTVAIILMFYGSNVDVYSINCQMRLVDEMGGTSFEKLNNVEFETGLSVQLGELNNIDANITAAGVLQDSVELTYRFTLAGKGTKYMERISTPILTERLNEIIETDEALHVNGGVALHKAMFNFLLYIVIFSAIFAIIIANRVGSYEYTEKAEATIYATKKGRKLASTKLGCSIIMAVGFYFAELLICFPIFFIRIPCFNLLNAPVTIIGNGMRGGDIVPWFNISIINYLLLTIAFSAMIIILFVVGAYIIYGFVGNGYLSLMTTFAISGIMMEVAAVVPADWAEWQFITRSAPVVLMMNKVGSFFAVTSSSTPLPFFEVFSIICWGALSSVAVIVAVVRIKKRSI